MTRIAMISTHFIPHVSGLTTHVLGVSRELVRRHGCKVTVFSPDFGGKFRDEGSTPEGIEYKNYRSIALSKTFCLPIQSPNSFLGDYQYDIVHVHSYTHPIPLLVAFERLVTNKRTGCKYVFTPHYHPFSGTLGTKMMRVPYDIAFRRLILGSFDGIICTTEAERRILMRETGTTPIMVIPNGVDLDEIQSVVVDGSITDLLRADERFQFRVVYCGNLLKYKGVQYVLHALSILKEGGISVELSVVGDGPYRVHLAKLTQDLGIQSQVRFLGFLPRSQQLGVIKASDALVLASEYESFGIVLVEAMALGKAVVASDVGGPTSMGIPKEFLVRYGDSHGLASALKLLVSSRVDRQLLGARYIQTVKEKYSWEQIGSSTADFYASL